MSKKVLQGTAVAALLLVGGASAALALQPPELLRVGANYGAKIVAPMCSSPAAMRRPCWPTMCRRPAIRC
jgi:hypothetical protein